MNELPPHQTTYFPLINYFCRAPSLVRNIFLYFFAHKINLPQFTHVAGHHESLRQDAVIVCQRSTAAPVCDQTQNEENGSSPPAGSRPGVTSRRGEVPTALRRSSVESPASSLAETSFKQLTNGLNNGSPPRAYNMSDETLEQLEKARLA